MVEGEPSRGTQELSSSRDDGPWAERPKMPGRNTVRRRVDAPVALLQLSPAIGALVESLTSRTEYEVLHGAMQTVLNYRGHGIGGINRPDASGYLSQALAVGSAYDRIRQLGFQLERMPSPGTAFRDHKWWQIDLVAHLTSFDQGLKEFERVVDRELARDT